ncbi:MraZ protein [Gemmobacter caeni]|jgi:MraZ protein|uniref:Transcriptional regulator MraZ n=2 Tax=Gemmobacter TaxID=204456 RepID=A0A2T6AYX1_9RHOB|nr:division/cell wall cluster transcriptional repressor MraZ [Gemmobacter caeni]TWI98999.1 MraZ protein [Gemmobacter caeni]GHC31595.1 transcriptional regulator MraZ [Gemmobacter nanjingensis]
MPERGFRRNENNRTGQGQQTVSESFRGEFNQKVDGKARVSIPASFRRVLEAGDPSFDGSRPKFVLVYGRPGAEFIEGYTMAQMARLEARIRRMQIGSKPRRALERNFITLSQQVEIDDDGRIVLPPKARDKIGLDADMLKDGAEATFAGTLDTFQIWRRDSYDALNAAAEEDDDLDDLIPEGADMLALLSDEPEE